MTMLRTINPVDGSVFAERPFASDGDIGAAPARSIAAPRDWRRRPCCGIERIALA